MNTKYIEIKYRKSIWETNITRLEPEYTDPKCGILETENMEI